MPGPERCRAGHAWVSESRGEARRQRRVFVARPAAGRGSSPLRRRRRLPRLGERAGKGLRLQVIAVEGARSAQRKERGAESVSTANRAQVQGLWGAQGALAGAITPRAPRSIPRGCRPGGTARSCRGPPGGPSPGRGTTPALPGRGAAALTTGCFLLARSCTGGLEKRRATTPSPCRRRRGGASQRSRRGSCSQCGPRRRIASRGRPGCLRPGAGLGRRRRRGTTT